MKNPSLVLGCLLLAFSGLSARAQSKDVLTYHDDNARDGQYLVETSLTPANVNTNTFGKLWVLGADANVDGEPLYAQNVTIPGKGAHNVVYVVSENDTVYAYDADSTNLFWHVFLIGSGETAATTLPYGCTQVSPQIGITSAPVIDRNMGPNGTIYMVAMTENGGSYFQRIHALDMATGTNIASPVEITGSYPGTGANSSGGNVIFDPEAYEDRCGLLLINGVIYTSWASHCDHDPYTGWIMGYDEHTLAQTNIINVTPNGSRGAIWMGNTAMAADANSNIVFLDANGIMDPNTNALGFPSQGDFGNAFLKISTSNKVLSVADFFGTSNTLSQSTGDLDLGSGGAIVMPPMLDSNGVTRNLSVGAGKDGNIYMVDLSNMGKYNTNDNNIYQQLNGPIGGCFSMPAYYNGTLYYGSVGDQIRAFPFKNARLQSQSSQTPETFGFPGSTPSISANGTSNGIVWAAVNASPGVLYAYSATNLAHELYNSSQAPGSRDNYGNGLKYVTPMIANGKVYIDEASGVGVFGLLGQTGPEPVASMAYVQQPTNTLLGAVISPGVEVEAIGTNGLPDPGATITVSLNGTGTLGGTPAQVTDVNGIAHFNDLTVDEGGQKSLTATASPGSASPTNSASFTIILPVAGLAFTAQPGNATAGAPFGQQPVLQTVDQNGTPSTAGLPATVFVNVAVSNATATLLGTTNYNIGTTGSNGIVQFSNLEIDTPGVGYQLIASSAGLPSNSVPGAVVWLDANNTASIATNASGVVSTWSNLGTRGATLGVAAGENGNAWTGPTFVGNSLNGKPVIRFSSTSTTQNPPGNVLTNTWPGLDEGTDLQFFMVMRQPADPINNWGGYVGFGNSTGAAGKNNSSLGEDTGWSSDGFRIFRNDANTSPAYTNAGQFTLANYPSTGIGANFNETNLGAWYNERPADGVPFVNAFYFHGSVNGGADYWADQNGNTWSNFQVSTVSYGDFNITDFGLGAQLGIAAGTPLDGPDWPMSVDIAEVLVYTNTMSDTDRGTVFSYLQNKWLVSGAGGSSLGSALSAPFTVQSSSGPPSKKINLVTLNANGSVTIGYATAPGFPYQVQTTTNLAMPWTTVPGSDTNPVGSSVTFTDSTSATTMARFYRVVSP